MIITSSSIKYESNNSYILIKLPGHVISVPRVILLSVLSQNVKTTCETISHDKIEQFCSSDFRSLSAKSDRRSEQKCQGKRLDSDRSGDTTCNRFLRRVTHSKHIHNASRVTCSTHSLTNTNNSKRLHCYH